MDGYFGTKIGKLQIPCYTFLKSNEHKGFGVADVKITWDNEKFTLKPEILSFKERLAKKKENEAKKQGSLCFDGQLVRMNSVNGGGKNANLSIQRTTFYDYLATNLSLDEKINGKTIREHCSHDPKNLDDCLTNPIGVSTLLLSDDNMMVYVKRSAKVMAYNGFFQNSSAGTMNPEDDFFNGAPSPFANAARELEEELGVSSGKNDYRILGFGRDSIDLHSEVFGVAKTTLKSKEILELSGKDGFENSGIYSIEFSPDKIVPFFKNYANAGRHEAADWVPASAVNSIYALMGEYGEEQVLKEIQKL